MHERNRTLIAASVVERRWFLPLVVAVGYALGSYVSFIFFNASTAGAVFFPPAGITLAALVSADRRQWPALLATVVVAELLVDLSQGQELRYVWGFVLANTAEPLVGAWLLSRHGRSKLSVAIRRLPVGSFLIGPVMTAPLVGAAFGTATVVWGQSKGTWGSVFGPFWAGDALAVLTVGGTLLSWGAPDGRRRWPPAGVSLAACAGVATLTAVGFWPASAPLFFLPLPLLAYLGFWLRSESLAYLAGLVMAIVANLMSALDHGPWASIADLPHYGLTTLQGFLAMATLTGVIVANQASERDDAQRQSVVDAVTRERLQVLYDHAPCGNLSLDARGFIVRVNETFLTLTGYSRDELLRDRRFSALLSMDGRLYYETHFMPLLHLHGAAHEIAFDMISADGARLPVFVNAEVVADSSSEPEEVRLAVFDGRERRAYEDELLRERERAEQIAQRLDALQYLTAQLAAASTTQEVAEAVLEAGIELISDHGVLGIIDRHDASAVHTWPSSPTSDPLVKSFLHVPVFSPLPVTWVIRTGEVLQLPTADVLQQRFPHAWPTHVGTGTVSCLGVPINTGKECVGALVFGFPTEGEIDPETLEFATAVATIVGTSIDRAWLYEHEYQTAHALQRALLPVIDDHFGDIDVLAYYRPASSQNDVGGDWYDVFALSDGTQAIVVGDIVGHDIAAATAMGHLQSAVRLFATDTSHPGKLLERLDRAVRSIPGADCATLFIARYDPATGLLTHSSAGHVPPILVTDTDIQLLDGGRSTPLGIGGERPVAISRFPAGARLLLYTDGLVEERGEPIVELVNRLKESAVSLSTIPPSTWCEDLLRERCGPRQFDDIVLVCLSRAREEHE